MVNLNGKVSHDGRSNVHGAVNKRLRWNIESGYRLDNLQLSKLPRDVVERVFNLGASSNFPVRNLHQHVQSSKDHSVRIRLSMSARLDKKRYCLGINHDDKHVLNKGTQCRVNNLDDSFTFHPSRRTFD